MATGTDLLQNVNWMWNHLQAKCLIEELRDMGAFEDYTTGERMIEACIRGFFLAMGRGVTDGEMQHLTIMVWTEIGLA